MEQKPSRPHRESQLTRLFLKSSPPRLITKATETSHNGEIKKLGWLNEITTTHYLKNINIILKIHGQIWRDLLQQSKVKRHFPNYFMINGEEITDSNIIANTFCKYFTDNGPSLSKNIKMPQNINAKDFLTGTHNCTFQFKNINDISILKIINELPNKSSTGFDDISMTLLKEIKTEIIQALTCNFNQSLKTGILPEKLKVAKIIPIHKKGSLNDISNHRPISLLPSISKILEKTNFQTISYIFKWT